MDNRTKKTRRHEEMEDDLLEKQLKDYVHGSDKEEDHEEAENEKKAEGKEEHEDDKEEKHDDEHEEESSHKKRKISTHGQISDIDIAGNDDEEEEREKAEEQKEPKEYEEDVDDEDKDKDYEQEEDGDEDDEESKRRSAAAARGNSTGKRGSRNSGVKNDAEAAVSTIRIHYQDLSGSARPDTTIDVSDPEDLMEHLRTKDGDEKRRRGRITKVTEETIQDWRKLRKESHKEVERRRRETINLAIDNLRKLLPKPEYSKAGILTSAAALIKKLKESESNHMNKWAISRIVAEQTKTSSEKAQEKMSEALDQSYKEIIRLRGILEENNIKFEDKFIIPEDALKSKSEEKEDNEKEEEKEDE